MSPLSSHAFGPILPRRWAALGFMVLSAAAACPSVAAVDRFVGWLEDGTKIHGRGLSAWPLPGTSFRWEERELIGGENPVRFMRDSRPLPPASGPCIWLANGDIVPGTPVELTADSTRGGQSPRVRVRLEPPLVPVSGTDITVRADRIIRLRLATDREPLRPPTADADSPAVHVVLASGRRLLARAIRWRATGLAVLTADGISEIPFSELADVVFPAVDRTAAVLDDNLWATGTGGAAIGRFHTTSGAAITASRVSREQEPMRDRPRVTTTAHYYLQPAWADEPLAIPEPEIGACGYRRATEAPLCFLPVRLVASRRLIAPEQPARPGALTTSLFAVRGRESDLGFATRSHSEWAFTLPPLARSLQMVVGLDRSVGDGGCVSCKVLAGKGEPSPETLWDGGPLQGKDGPRGSGPIAIDGAKEVILVTEFAHDNRPAGSDPLDIRDEVVWLSPLVKLDLSKTTFADRALAMLPGMSEWSITPTPTKATVTSRWNVPGSVWDAVLTIPKEESLILGRRLAVSRASDVLELLTVCPPELDEHDFRLRVNGEDVEWRNNADRNELRQWTIRYSRTRARAGDDETNLTDRLAYWWDLSRWRGQTVDLELTLAGKREQNAVAWRGLAPRAAIGNLPASGEPLRPDVPLADVPPLSRSQSAEAGVSAAVLNAVPRGRESEPIRFLGQRFSGGYGLGRSSTVTFPLKPENRTFVAVVGCSFQVAGPIRVLIDGATVWERPSISSLSPAEQIEIKLPAGAKTLTLESGPEGPFYGSAAFAEAGFTTASAR